MTPQLQAYQHQDPPLNRVGSEQARSPGQRGHCNTSGAHAAAGAADAGPAHGWQAAPGQAAAAPVDPPSSCRGHSLGDAGERRQDGPDSPDMLPMLRDGKSNTAASEKEVLATARLTRASCCWCCVPVRSCGRRLPPPTAVLIAIGSDRACCSPLCPASEDRNRGLMGLADGYLEPALPPNKPPKKLPLPRKLPLPPLVEAVLRAGGLPGPAPPPVFECTRSWCGRLGAEHSAALPAACGAALPCSSACRPLGVT